jgi:hyperosmotically inducible protein
MKKAFIAVLVVLLAGTAAAGPLPPQAASEDLERAVLKTLWSLPHYTVFDNLFFEMSGADVTLGGQVTLEITKAEAAKRVAKIKGIAKVFNKIEVLPPSSSDDSLRLALFRRIFNTPGLDRYGMGADPSIHIIVKGGHVTLVGLVSTESDRQRAEMAAKDGPGIMSFKNDLRVEK